DRMLWTLKRAKKLDKLKGLIVGGFTDMRDSSASFGQSIEEIILDKVQEYDFPVAFGCPVGHIADNRTLILGQQIKLSVQKTKISIHYID
ncbi:LD-carboxypeptidase, partial [Parapusillimonas sp. SGNA-6]|nr:LD-carboxypeptidase [Parapusillimonas sp. SGNA-6]